MAQNTDATTDRIAKNTVARIFGELGESPNPHNESPPNRFVDISHHNRYDNVQRALFIDSHEPAQIAYAWTNDNRNSYKVKENGTEITVTDVSRLEIADNDDPVEDEIEYVQVWIEILLDELRFDAEKQSSRASVSDEIEFIGQQILRIRDVDGRIAEFSFEITGEN